jgi:hypothetical protein
MCTKDATNTMSRQLDENNSLIILDFLKQFWIIFNQFKSFLNQFKPAIDQFKLVKCNSKLFEKTQF